MLGFTRKVDVTFIDDATGAAFANAPMPPGDLPETFAVQTTMHLGTDDWRVVAADPPTREAFARSGALTLRLRRVERLADVDPADILFSLPSICDRLPGLSGGALGGDELTLAEDDWRQVEFVSRQFAAAADEEIDAILRIHAEERAAVGWRAIHVRRRPEPPISGPLTLEDVRRALDGEAARGAALAGHGSPATGGFSLAAADGLRCYGIVDSGRVAVLGVDQDGLTPGVARSAAALADLARGFDLDLVHWCRCVRASADDPSFGGLLAGEG